MIFFYILVKGVGLILVEVTHLKNRIEKNYILI
jgi:hypothetical protein